MKDFIKMVGAVICGLFIMGVLGFVLISGIIGAFAVSSSSAQPVIPKSGVLRIDMSSVQIAEQSLEMNPIASISGRAFETVGIRAAVNAINAAATDPRVKYIYLKTDGLLSSLAETQEFRKALVNFRKNSGKAVVAYLESPSTGSYYLASVADKVYMTPHGGATISVLGVSSQAIFVKDLLDKLGVNVQLIRHGKYKSAGEMFIRNDASPENREQNQVMVDALWKSLADEIAESRGITFEALDDAVNDLALCLPEDFLAAGLVDELLDRNGLENKIASLAVADNYKSVKMIKFADYVRAVTPVVKPFSSADKIAVVYADGEIIDGSDTKEVAGDRFAALIEEVRADSTVKAVVLRVNSPGGSVLASEKIKAELDRFQGVKPLVASYGDLAASGGYWISNACDHIFSDAVTLTGSIGVFGMIPDFSGTLKDVAHVNVTSFNSNRHSDMYSLTRPFDSAEYAYMQRSIEDIYDRFTTIVSEGRNLPKERVDEIGQGRVWAGSDALAIGLVDEIGTLEDAIAWAADAAGNADVAQWTIADYPAVPTIMEMMLASLGGTEPTDFSVFAKYAKNIKEPKLVARLPYEIVIK